jgi:outer membrane protein OmpA-like peptidoglycan-associated protein
MQKIVLAAILLCTPALAQEEPPTDAEGCKDSPLVGRMPGSIIIECSDKEFDEAEMAVTDVENKKFEGATTRRSYSHKKGQSALQIIRNYEGALKKIGFRTVHTAEGNQGTMRNITLRKEGKGAAAAYIEAAWEGDPSSSSVTIVKIQEMEQQIAADASALLDELNKSGHVAVYGINFETGKAAITADSAKALDEVVKLFQQSAGLKLRVEGHTDNVGKSKENVELSKKRAASVKEWLVQHGVEAVRLTTDGFGDKKPVADNKTDEGRAKNRRVELVKT